LAQNLHNYSSADAEKEDGDEHHDTGACILQLLDHHAGRLWRVRLLADNQKSPHGVLEMIRAETFMASTGLREGISIKRIVMWTLIFTDTFFVSLFLILLLRRFLVGFGLLQQF
jgi:hypothetical protein